MYTVIIKPKAQKQIEKLSQRDQDRIAQVIDQLTIDPYYGKKLNGDLASLYAVRIWPFRLIYAIEKEMIAIRVLSVGHRKDVYRNL